MEQGNKILIISQQDEHSTDKVLQYLLHYNSEFIRINENDIVQSANIIFDKQDYFKLFYNNCTIDFDKIFSVWYRRGKLNLLKKILYPLSHEELQLYQYYQEHSYQKEMDDIMQYIYLKLKDKKHINNFNDNVISKLVQLNVALKNELKVPKTIITNSIKTTMEYFENSEIIFKSIHWNLFSFSTNDGKHFKAGIDSSKLLNKENLVDLINNKGSEKILYSLYQEYINKKFELRIFYLNGMFYPMAIFSQQNEETKVDWRNENIKNRISVFKLPEHMEFKINRFMNDLQLNCGSLDFIYTPNNEYIFLEVNPIGQFDWLSSGCNYFIEKHIANELRI